MANPNFKDFSGKAPPPTGSRGKDASMPPMKTANWPGLAAKTGPNRDKSGTAKVKVHPKSEGI
jgi:hypothetical protein